MAGLIADHMGHLTALYLDRIAGELADSPVSAAEFVALVVLDAFPRGLTQSEWGRLQGVTRQRAHTVAKRLTDAGLVDVTRRGRASEVTLTNAGSALLAERRPRVEASLGRAMARLSAAEGAQLLALLERLLEAPDPDQARPR